MRRRFIKPLALSIALSMAAVPVMADETTENIIIITDEDTEDDDIETEEFPYDYDSDIDPPIEELTRDDENIDETSEEDTDSSSEDSETEESAEETTYEESTPDETEETTVETSVTETTKYIPDIEEIYLDEELADALVVVKNREPLEILKEYGYNFPLEKKTEEEVAFVKEQIFYDITSYATYRGIEVFKNVDYNALCVEINNNSEKTVTFMTPLISDFDSSNMYTGVALMDYVIENWNEEDIKYNVRWLFPNSWLTEQNFECII